LVISLLIVLSSFLVTPAFAEDMCLPSDTVGQMTVDLEKYQLLKDRYSLLTDANIELEKQVILLEKINGLQKEQLQVVTEANIQYKQLILDQGTLYKEMLKASKPSFGERLMNTLGAFGLGALFALIVL
jgi:hypothetical protein